MSESALALNAMMGSAELVSFGEIVSPENISPGTSSCSDSSIWIASISRSIGFSTLIERQSLVVVPLVGVLMLRDSSSLDDVSCVEPLGSVSLSSWDRSRSRWSTVTVVAPLDILRVVEWIGIE